jgi:SAM-dependent methyltransferase
MVRFSLIEDGQLRIDRLIELMQPPPLFEPGATPFWDDPHIAKGMLAAHLSPDTEAASRPPAMIDATIQWLSQRLPLKPGDCVLDLGCGPGLYAERLAARGMRVTGIDFSRSSIEHARRTAQERDLPITYLYQDFRAIDYDSVFDAVLQVYGEMDVFAPVVRDDILRRVHRALKPDGRFVFDVTTRAHRKKYGQSNYWYASGGGFWRPGEYVVLGQGFDYPDVDTWCDQYVIVEADGSASVYRNWFLDYSPETITAALEGAGFRVEALYGDLTGAPLASDSEWIGVVAGMEE